MAKTAKAKTGKVKNGKVPPARKPTAEELSDQQRQTLLFQHRRKVKPLLAAKKFADSALQKAYELAKKEGITRQEIELAIKLETDEGTEAVKSKVEQMMRVARWIGSKIGSQLDLFPAGTKAEQAYDDGKRAALDDQACRPPEHLSQASAQQWITGHGAGRAQLNELRAQGFRPLGDVVSDLATTGTEPEAIGTEEASHQEAA